MEATPNGLSKRKKKEDQQNGGMRGMSEKLPWIVQLMKHL